MKTAAAEIIIFIKSASKVAIPIESLPLKYLRINYMHFKDIHLVLHNVFF